MKKLLWASPHLPTAEQIKSLEAMGEIVFLKDIAPNLYSRMVDSPADTAEINELARDILAFLDEDENYILIQPAGSPALQFALGKTSGANQLVLSRIVYAHSKRISIDTLQPDGSVKKESLFRHENWLFM